MINSLSTLADEIFTKNSWGFLILSTIEFFGLLFLLSWYYVLIQVSFGQYKIAKELRSTNSTTVPTRIPIILPPTSNNPQPPRQSQPQINIIENDNNDSSETSFSPFNTT
uniref:Transmembrane protein n=1 Tax=Panagrolaimus sp. PS1159 TaxID=55785 RepID=A0AC35GTZ0_9BILA